jgi:hypothetical protein
VYLFIGNQPSPIGRIQDDQSGFMLSADFSGIEGEKIPSFDFHGVGKCAAGDAAS